MFLQVMNVFAGFVAVGATFAIFYFMVSDQKSPQIITALLILFFAFAPAAAWLNSHVGRRQKQTDKG
jgi:ABC-type uncharacterized transport system permease subunit